MEKLMLAPREQRRHRHRHQEEELRDVLLGHNNDADAIKENGLWKGMLLLPYANRIAYVGPFTISTIQGARTACSGNILHSCKVNEISIHAIVITQSYMQYGIN